MIQIQVKGKRPKLYAVSSERGVVWTYVFLCPCGSLVKLVIEKQPEK